MTELFSKSKEWLSAEKPFVLFRKPGQSTATGIFQRGKVSHGCNKTNQAGFVFAPFADGQAWLLPDWDCDRLTAEVEVQELASKNSEQAADAAAKATFESLVAKAVAAIEAGQFEKVVVSRRESAQIKNFDLASAFARLCGKYPSAFVYAWFHPETGIWLAATPEKLLQANGKQFETMALAGTQKFAQGATWQQKEIQEQQFVTDFIAGNLENLAASLEIGAPYTYQAGNLLHIRTDIKGELQRESDLPNVISALHPTPAVCGLPKPDAMAFILENESYDREYYTGYLGELNAAGGTDLYVNLRCMKVVGEVATIFVGCGVTVDSDAEMEFLETVNKAMTIRAAFEN